MAVLDFWSANQNLLRQLLSQMGTMGWGQQGGGGMTSPGNYEVIHSGYPAVPPGLLQQTIQGMRPPVTPPTLQQRPNSNSYSYQNYANYGNSSLRINQSGSGQSGNTYSGSVGTYRS